MFEERSWGEYQVFDMVSAEEEQKVWRNGKRSESWNALLAVDGYGNYRDTGRQETGKDGAEMESERGMQTDEKITE